MTMDIILFFVGTILVFFAGYYIIHSKMRFTNLGRIVSAIVLGGTTLLDQAQALPWGSILSAARAEAVAFGLSAGLVILHFYKVITDALGLNSPEPPPPPSGS